MQRAERYRAFRNSFPSFVNSYRGFNLQITSALQHSNEDLQTFDHDKRTSTVALAEFPREGEDVHPFSVVIGLQHL